MVKEEEQMDVETTEVGSKRKNLDSDQAKIKKKPYDISGKNPSQVFHDIFRDTELSYQQVDEKKSKSFQVNAVVEGKRFEGTGPSKSHAKRDLAIKALHQLKGFALLKPETPVYPAVATQVVLDQKTPLHCTAIMSSGLIENLPTIDVQRIRCAPVIMLTQVFPEAELSFTVGGRGNKLCRVETEIIGRRFFGEGRSKRMAKLNLAKTVFLVLYNINDFETYTILDEAPCNEEKKKKKVPMTELKELVGDDMKVEVERLEEDDGENKFQVTIIVKGISYQEIGNNKFTASSRAARKALEVLDPKPKTSEFENTYGVDVASHPSYAFQQHFPGVEISESESKAEEGFPAHHFEVNVNSKSYKVAAPSKKKGKLRLILQVFEDVKKTAPNEWKDIDLDKIYEDKPRNVVSS